MGKKKYITPIKREVQNTEGHNSAPLPPYLKIYDCS